MTVGVVVPCFNEAACRDVACERDLLGQASSRFLFVHDAPTDATREKIQKAIGGINGQLLSMPVKRGNAEAVRQGILELLNDQSVRAVGHLDADDAFVLSDIARLLSLLSS